MKTVFLKKKLNLHNNCKVCLFSKYSSKIVTSKLARAQKLCKIVQCGKVCPYLLLHSAVTVFPTLEKRGIWAAFLNVMPVNLSNVSVPPSEHVGRRCAGKIWDFKNPWPRAKVAKLLVVLKAGKLRQSVYCDVNVSKRVLNKILAKYHWFQSKNAILQSFTFR